MITFRDRALSLPMESHLDWPLGEGTEIWKVGGCTMHFD